MTLRLIVISDHHLGHDAMTINRGYATHWALERVLDAITDAGWHGANALLSIGDLVDVGDAASYRFARSLLGVTSNDVPAHVAAPGPLKSRRKGLEGLPLYLVPGNHDAPRSTWLRELFPGTPETDATDLHLPFEILRHRFVFLDLGTGSRAGVLTPTALRVLDEALERGPTTVVLHHHPIPVGIPWLDRAVPDGIEELWRRLDRGILAVVFGHAHVDIDVTRDGVPILGTQSTCFQFAVSEEPSFVMQPLRYRTLTITPQGVRSDRYEVALDGPARARRLP